MKLAEQMSCTVREAQARVTSAEFTEWIAYWLVQSEPVQGAREARGPRCGSGNPKEMKSILKMWLASQPKAPKPNG